MVKLAEQGASRIGFEPDRFSVAECRAMHRALDAGVTPTGVLEEIVEAVVAAAHPGDTVLVQGAGGGVATAAIMLGRAMGLRVWVTSRDEDRLQRAIRIGAHDGFSSGARLPDRVDAVIESFAVDSKKFTGDLAPRDNTALRATMAAAASGWPRCSSIIAPDQIWPIGLAIC